MKKSATMVRNSTKNILLMTVFGVLTMLSMAEDDKYS